MKYKHLKLPIIISASLISTLSSTASATEGGTDINWIDHSYIVESDCTGTVLAGKFIILAGHCGAWASNPFPRLVRFSNGDAMLPTSRNADPYYDKGGKYNGGVDTAIWTLPESAKMDKVIFIADLNDAAKNPKINDKVTVFGFGRDNNTAKLGKIESIITNITDAGITYSDAIQHTVPGDSGGPVLNGKNELISTHYSATGSIDPLTGMYDGSGANLVTVKDWLLESVNSWHSATELKFTGTKTIDVQSLHVDNVNMIDSWNAGTLTSGGVTVTGGSCVTKADVKPFGMCTLELEATTEQGFVNLDDDNKITINRTVKPEPEPEPKPAPNTDSGKSGGSMGIFSLLALFGISLRRKFNS